MPGVLFPKPPPAKSTSTWIPPTRPLLNSQPLQTNLYPPLRPQIVVHLWQTGTGCLSFQVLLEFYAPATRKLSPGLPTSIARQEIRKTTFGPLNIAN
jgi:hypothetical protein